MTANSTAQTAPSWRKAKRTLMLKIAFFLILAGFAAGYSGGVADNSPLIACAFALWGSASALALMVK